MYFENQTFLVAGLSRSGIAAAEYLRTRGAEVFVFDDVEDKTVEESSRRLMALGCVPVKKDELFEKAEMCDILVLSPGIPVDHALPVSFRRAGKRIIGESELGALALKCPVVAVAGTNGKTTTVTMLESVFRASGKNAIACGNVGKPVTSCIKELGEEGIAVAEISSFQLETLTSLRPHVSVILNISEDHLNRHYNMENYIFLKSRLLKNSTESEYCVLNYDDPVVRTFKDKTKAIVEWFSLKEKVDGAYLENNWLCYNGERVMSRDELPLDGEHNTANALAALAAAKIMGVGNASIIAAFKSFRGIRHRLEKIGSVNGVNFIDDSKATNVDSAIKAIESVRGETVLLVGGKDKGYSYEPLFEAIKKSGVVHTVLYGENAFRILDAAVKSGFTAVTLCRPFDLAVRVAYLTAKRGQSVLLSPASASFDAFKNYEERGDKFREIYKILLRERENADDAAGAAREDTDE